MQKQYMDSLSEKIAQHISDKIIVGDLVEGERIPELSITQELDVSRGSVREALLLLERTHLIEIYPRRGAVVSEMSTQKVTDLFNVTSLLLGTVVYRIAETWHLNDMIKIRDLLEQLVEACQAGNINQFYDLIFQLFAQEEEFIGNIYVIRFYQELLPSLRRSYFLVLNTSRRELQESLELFKLVIDAILTRKSQQATLFMEDFCRHLCDLVLESLTRMKQIELAWARRSRRKN
ncbi:GntR family transcriptional regulator [Acinetobacter equi]|uniref:GntR family transcriptional regulator n=1 Tax=Acinetobacter equi TaxID=1324350 RepID=A0A0N9VVW3_9GAMM|nr:GntR family transcriptional regulator [Acinetobacter equi]ALH94168.1 GntR family transcriptional regulator [Acinetobacter equi]